MKSNIFQLAIASLMLLTAACTTDGENDDMFNLAQIEADVEKITNTAMTGPWIITNFVDSGRNETADFKGYGFSFNQDGSLVANNGSATVTGTWSVTRDDDFEDDSSDDSSSGNDDGVDDCNSCTVELLTEVLTACEDWFVDKLERNDNDLEGNFTGYAFNFSSDGTIKATSGSESYSGTWKASGTGNNIQVVLTISGLSDFEYTWTLHEIELENGESKVDLRINGDDRLRFKNRCTIGNFNGGQSTGQIDFNIFFASPDDFNELSEDWDIVSYSSTRIELIHVSGSDGGVDLLTFEK